MKTKKECMNISTISDLKNVIRKPEHYLKDSLKSLCDPLCQLIVRYEDNHFSACLLKHSIDVSMKPSHIRLHTYSDIDDIPVDHLKNSHYEMVCEYHHLSGQWKLVNIHMNHANFTKLNQEAWNEAYLKSPQSYKAIAQRLDENPTQFLTPRLMKHLDKTNLKDHIIAQLACNNGREILAILKHYGAKKAMGFDISEAMIHDANQTTRTLHLNAEFIQTNLYDIKASYHEQFDDIFMMIGAITWFDDLKRLFKVVSDLLKPQGHFYLLDGHPITGMFAFEGEEGFDPNLPSKLVYSYFKKEPFVETDGMYYMTKQLYKSHPFVSFSHTFQDIIQGLIDANLRLMVFEEGNENMLENFPDLDGKHIPLIFYIDSIKQKP